MTQADFERIVVTESPNGPLHVDQGTFEIHAGELRASGHAHVIAAETAHIVLYGNATCEISGEASCAAFGANIVIARDRATLIVGADVLVEAHDYVRVTGARETTLISYGPGTISVTGVRTTFGPEVGPFARAQQAERWGTRLPAPRPTTDKGA